MCRRSILFAAGVLLLSGLVSAGAWSPRVVSKIQDNTVAIAVFYFMPESVLQTRVQQLQGGKVGGGAAVFAVNVGQEQALCYLGSGTILPDDYIVTVRHLFVHQEGATKRLIWVMHPKIDHPLAADVTTLTTGDDTYYDYGVIQLQERLGFPGVEIAKESPAIGEEVAFGGSLRGTAFFLRFGVATRLQWYFRKDENGILHLSRFMDFPYIVAYPSGPGDSGSGVFNRNGELCGVGYCGIDLSGTSFLMSNPIDVLHRFLREALLGKLVPR